MLISDYLDCGVRYKETELETREDFKKKRSIYELHSKKPLPSVINTFVKCIGLFLLFTFYVLIMFIFKDWIYAKLSLDKFRIDACHYKHNLDTNFLKFFYQTTTENVQVNYKEPGSDLEAMNNAALEYPKFFVNNIENFDKYFQGNKPQFEKLLNGNFCEE